MLGHTQINLHGSRLLEDLTSYRIFFRLEESKQASLSSRLLEDFFQFRFQFLAIQVGGDNLTIWVNENDSRDACNAI